jgi:hypothetical protein
MRVSLRCATAAGLTSVWVAVTVLTALIMLLIEWLYGLEGLLTGPGIPQ